MEPRIVRELTSHLARDERLIWAGCPAPLPYALSETGPKIVVAAIAEIGLAIAMGIVAGGWFGWSEAGLARILILAIGLPILLVFVGALSTPVRRFIEARQVIYGLTDRRAILLVGGSTPRIEEVPTSRFVHPVTTRNRDGSRNLLFFEEVRMAPGAFPAHSGVGFRLKGFLGIRAPDDLEHRVARMVQQS